MASHKHLCKSKDTKTTHCNHQEYPGGLDTRPGVPESTGIGFGIGFGIGARLRTDWIDGVGVHRIQGSKELDSKSWSSQMPSGDTIGVIPLVSQGSSLSYDGFTHWWYKVRHTLLMCQGSVTSPPHSSSGLEVNVSVFFSLEMKGNLCRNFETELWLHHF